MPSLELDPIRPRASFSSPEDVTELVDTLGRFERGEIDADAWRAFHLVRGVYPQRDGEGHMLRVKVPEGALTAPQLVAIADVAERFSRGFGHVTTRQNVQLHFVARADLPAAVARLAEAGITTREACGNAVRNVTLCAWAGVAPDETFDPTPYAEAVTRHFLRHPLASSLPRKFKIAFEGCARDHAALGIQDLGFRAIVREGRRGFRVNVAGGTATVPVSGAVLFDFLPAAEVISLAEAVLRLFHARGNRADRSKARLKFLVKTLGWEGFRAAVFEALGEVRAEGGVRLPFEPEQPPVEEAPSWPRPEAPSPAAIAARGAAGVVQGPGLLPVPAAPSPFASWRKTNVRRQRQPGYAAVSVTLPLGDVTGTQLRVLAELAQAHGDGQARLTEDQDLVLRWVPEAELPALHAALAAAGLALDGAHGIADVTSCPGAETCRLAVTESRGLGRALAAHLRESPLAALAPDLELKVSGCPNGCGRHHVAGIGFQGSARKLDGRALPQYFVLVGGGVDDAGARFGRLAAKIPARRVTAALDRLLELYGRERQEGETAAAFFARVDITPARAALADLAELAPENAQPNDFLDLTGSEP